MSDRGDEVWWERYLMDLGGLHTKALAVAIAARLDDPETCPCRGCVDRVPTNLRRVWRSMMPRG